MSSDNSSPTSRFALARRLAPALALTSAGVALINVLDRPVDLSASGSAGVADIGGSTEAGAGQTVTGATVPAPTTTTVTAATVVTSTVPPVNGATPDTTPVTTPAPASAPAACGAKINRIHY